MSKKNKKSGVATKPANITPAPAVDTTATDAPAAPVVCRAACAWRSPCFATGCARFGTAPRYWLAGA